MKQPDQEMSSYSCGEITSAGEFNFVSPAYPVSVGQVHVESVPY